MKQLYFCITAESNNSRNERGKFVWTHESDTDPRDYIEKMGEYICDSDDYIAVPDFPVSAMVHLMAFTACGVCSIPISIPLSITKEHRWIFLRVIINFKPQMQPMFTDDDWIMITERASVQEKTFLGNKRRLVQPSWPV
jgi:hypothetical protein